MIKIIFIILFLSCTCSSSSQVNKCGPPCVGMDILDVGLHVTGQKPVHENYFYSINISQLQKGFNVALNDKSYKIVWLLLSHASDDKVYEYPVNGDQKIVIMQNSFPKLRPAIPS